MADSRLEKVAFEDPTLYRSATAVAALVLTELAGRGTEIHRPATGVREVAVTELFHAGWLRHVVVPSPTCSSSGGPRSPRS